MKSYYFVLNMYVPVFNPFWEGYLFKIVINSGLRMWAIEARNLWKIYPNGIQAVRGINLRIPRNEIFGLLGPNGAGKTTTIRMIMGLLAPTDGTIFVWGHDVVADPIVARKYIGYVPQFFSLYPDLTVMENMMFYAKLYELPGSLARERINEIMEITEIKRYRDVLAGNLSGGFKRRLELAVALIHDPPILLLDEPTAGVDPPIRRAFWELFRNLRKEGKTILVTTHYMDEAENCDKLALISYGKIIAEGSPREIKKKTFGGDIIRIKVRGDVGEIINSLPIKKLMNIKRSNASTEIYALVNDYGVDMPNIVEFLSNHGLDVLLIEPVPVTLEDAFIELVKRAR